MVYGNADCLIPSDNAGTIGGTAWTRPSSVPASSATLLATNYVYNAAGWLDKNKGVGSRSQGVG